MCLEPSLRSKRLLVIEDDPDQCGALKDRLELYGYDVACAGDGREAMLLLNCDAYDGIVLDLNLPLLSGNDILVQASRAHPQVPIIVMSASNSRLREAKASGSKACCYMLKPYGLHQFKHVLHSCFGPAGQPPVSS
jgi:DNA-binding response OmpR family regulator